MHFAVDKLVPAQAQIMIHNRACFSHSISWCQRSACVLCSPTNIPLDTSFPFLPLAVESPDEGVPPSDGCSTGRLEGLILRSQLRHLLGVRCIVACMRVHNIDCSCFAQLCMSQLRQFPGVRNTLHACLPALLIVDCSCHQQLRRSQLVASSRHLRSHIFSASHQISALTRMNVWACIPTYVYVARTHQHGHTDTRVTFEQRTHCATAKEWTCHAYAHAHMRAYICLSCIQRTVRKKIFWNASANILICRLQI